MNPSSSRGRRSTPVCLAALVALLVAVPAAEARKSQFMIFEPSREIRSHDLAQRARVLDEVKGFGVGWIRIVMYWRDVAPPAPAR